MSNPLLARDSRRWPADPALRARDERLESLKAVVGKLAHDFNNFLVPQFGYITLLKEEITSGTQAALYAATMEAAGRKSEAYIESILLGMRPHRQFAPHEFQFDGLVQRALEGWAEEKREGANIEITSDLQPFTFCGDEKHWANALTQLLSNARFALALGGRIELTLRPETISGEEVQRLGLETNEVVRLRLHDSGFGMNPETVKRAFEPFFTTRTQIKAAGLGLTIVHSVAQFHGGQVELESIEDAGTTVTVWIPRGGANSRERLASIGGAFRTNPQKRPRILLIEDDPLMKEVLRTWLARFEHDTETASSLLEVRKALQRSSSDFALVISETDLQSGSGEEIYREASGLSPGLPWIFLTARREPVFAPHPGRQEPLVMKKPFSLKAFGEVVLRHTSR
ncbi:MAG TPA: ATP-binding protein [Verrucomicrobiae bacterium]|nr:ATP-binding protein [Verrucomicrobiae bacterium]